MPKYKDIDYDLFNSYFYYDETALSFLRWREDHAAAGGLNGNYWQVELLDMGQFKVHRIIFCIMNGGIDSELMIDHIDRNTRNNNIWNLRAVDSSQNNYNRTPSEYENCKRANGIPRNIYVNKVRPRDSYGRDYLTAQIKNPITNKRVSKSGYDLQELLLWLEIKKAEFGIVN